MRWTWPWHSGVLGLIRLGTPSQTQAGGYRWKGRDDYVEVSMTTTVMIDYDTFCPVGYYCLPSSHHRLALMLWDTSHRRYARAIMDGVNDRINATLPLSPPRFNACAPPWTAAWPRPCVSAPPPHPAQSPSPSWLLEKARCRATWQRGWGPIEPPPWPPRPPSPSSLCARHRRSGWQAFARPSSRVGSESSPCQPRIARRSGRGLPVSPMLCGVWVCKVENSPAVPVLGSMAPPEASLALMAWLSDIVGWVGK